MSLTIHLPPDKDYLEYHGEIIEDTFRSQMYKYMCQLERARVLFYPHKFTDSTNATMPFTNVVLNPKFFDCYDDLESYLFSIFDGSDFETSDIKIARIDVASDITGINVEAIIATLAVKHIRMRTFRIISNTIYAGRNPKVRIYDKLEEIRYRLKKGQGIIEAERKMLELNENLTRFEVAIGRPNINLKELRENPVGLVSYFDKLDFIKMNCSTPCGVRQFMHKNVNRKFRKQIEKLMDNDILEKIKDGYISEVTEWFQHKELF